MSELHQRIFVNCPAHAAGDYLSRFFADRRQVDKPDSNEPVRLALRAPVSLPGLQTEIMLQRDVVATIAPAPNVEGALATMNVVWEPAGGGPFPRFTGQLLAKNDEGYDSFSLVLDGSYVAPLGVGGAAFDAALGHRIAIATARNLIAEIRDAIEKEYAATEYKKKIQRDEETRQPQH